MAHKKNLSLKEKEQLVEAVRTYPYLSIWQEWEGI